MRRCTGTHTWMSEHPNSFPGPIHGTGKDKDAAEEDALEKGRAAAKDFCAKKPCAHGDCKMTTWGHKEVVAYETSDYTTTVVWDITWIDCKCAGEED